MRVDPDTEAAVDRLACTTGKSRASVVGEAVARYAVEAHEIDTAYEGLRPLIGAYRSGRGDLAQHTGRKVAELLRKRRTDRARRTR
jgi:hypothetical protein